MDDDLDAAGGTDLSITSLADSWAGFKLELLASIDVAHNATFSNGFAGAVAGPKVSTSPRLQNVPLLIISRWKMYCKEEHSPAPRLPKRTNHPRGISRVLSNDWWYPSFLSQRGEIRTTPSWYTSRTSQETVPNGIKTRVTMTSSGSAGPRGCFFSITSIRRANSSGHRQELRMMLSPRLEISTSVSSAATPIDFCNTKLTPQAELQDLFSSAADMYLGHGLTSTGVSYFLPDIVKSWFAQSDNTIFRHPGMFTLPVCELQYYNWKQSDNAGTLAPPCDCRKLFRSLVPSLFPPLTWRVSLVTATDAWGDKFMDVAQDDVKTWINSKCHWIIVLQSGFMRWVSSTKREWLYCLFLCENCTTDV